MRRIKLFGFAITAVLAFTAVIASTAAAKPEFLDNVKGNTFTGKGGAGAIEVLGGGLKIACTEDTFSGEITGNEEGTISKLDFKGCTALGFKANSLGDAEGTILADGIPFKLCYINEATKDVGIYLEKINVHEEVPALVGTLINLTGSIIALIEPINKLTTTGTIKLTQTAAGDQSFTTCKLLGKELKASFFSSKDAKHEKNESASLVQEETITFVKDIQIDA